MDCFLFQKEPSVLKNQVYPKSSLSITESSSYTDSNSLNSFSVSSAAADSMSISTVGLSISTAESSTGIFSKPAVCEKVMELNSGDDPSAKTPKTPPTPPRLIWTVQLHHKFVDAVTYLGIENAAPKTILQLMSVDGLTLDDVASHLETYQVYSKKTQKLSNRRRGRSGGGGGNGGRAHSFSESSRADDANSFGFWRYGDANKTTNSPAT